MPFGKHEAQEPAREGYLGDIVMDAGKIESDWQDIIILQLEFSFKPAADALFFSVSAGELLKELFSVLPEDNTLMTLFITEFVSRAKDALADYPAGTKAFLRLPAVLVNETLVAHLHYSDQREVMGFLLEDVANLSLEQQALLEHAKNDGMPLAATLHDDKVTPRICESLGIQVLMSDVDFWSTHPFSIFKFFANVL
ncbi:MAG: hypothetical protein COY40_04905 [Alphaproteobacteria bacterium CG_4_10_14_0_8_um_filter_53_9]|nr:MAG: hypothetical protein COY40_04905 [Alphaproteobacteria bacterium CG_4_10_14_0_8_um_filter_53_9]